MDQCRYSVRWLPAVALGLLLGACSGDRGEGAAEDVPADMTRATLFDPALFDSIDWGSRGEARSRGATVYAYSCAKCHGPKGAGDGGYRLDGRLIQPPSFLSLDWRFAEDPLGLREAIYTGSNGRMPHWGRAGLAPRDVDAVAEYIRNELWARAY